MLRIINSQYGGHQFTLVGYVDNFITFVERNLSAFEGNRFGDNYHYINTYALISREDNYPFYVR